MCYNMLKEVDIMSKFLCPSCDKTCITTTSVNAGPHNSIIRTKICKYCGTRFSTMEVITRIISTDQELPRYIKEK